jgi:hypothetical protein
MQAPAPPAEPGGYVETWVYVTEQRLSKVSSPFSVALPPNILPSALLRSQKSGQEKVVEKCVAQSLPVWIPPLPYPLTIRGFLGLVKDDLAAGCLARGMSSVNSSVMCGTRRDGPGGLMYDEKELIPLQPCEAERAAYW